MMIKKVFMGVLSALLLLLISGCGLFESVTSKEENSKISIDKDKAKALDLELNIGAGELVVSRGAKEWVEGTIKYNSKNFKPEVSYKLKGKKGIGVIEQPNLKKIKTSKVKNSWNLELNDSIPLDLTINSGASKTELDLKGLEITNLEVNAGVGDITIDLGGKWKKSFEATIEMGVGKSTIILPKDVGVKIKSSKGIGSAEFVGFISKGNGVYVNEAYENAEVIIDLQTELGIGEAIFKLE